jgi:hypothetical protein
MLISLTRVRLASRRYLVPFLWYTWRCGLQARNSPGFRGMRVLADRQATFWTVTAWQDLASMKVFRSAGAHRVAMRHLADWCEEASFTRWEGSIETMKDWRDAHRRMLATGAPSHVKRPSPLQAAGTWPMPRLRPLWELVVSPKR